MNKDITCIADLSRGDVEALMKSAFSFKSKAAQGVRRENHLDGRTVAMIFEKPSLRTKVAFEVAAYYLGGNSVFLESHQIMASGGNSTGRETVADIARNLERFSDIIVARVFHQSVIHELATSIKLPVVNALSDRHHPSQALADLMAIQWHKPHWKSIKVAFVGDGNNVSTSLMQICALMGISFAIASPVGHEIPEEEVIIAQRFAAESGAELSIGNDPESAVRHAEIVATDTFVSMGQDPAKAANFKGYQVDAALFSCADRGALFMHCLPAHRGEEVTAEVFDSPQSIVFDEAECRLHVAKAIVAALVVTH